MIVSDSRWALYQRLCRLLSVEGAFGWFVLRMNSNPSGTCRTFHSTTQPWVAVSLFEHIWPPLRWKFLMQRLMVASNHVSLQYHSTYPMPTRIWLHHGLLHWVIICEHCWRRYHIFDPPPPKCCYFVVVGGLACLADPRGYASWSSDSW